MRKHNAVEEVRTMIPNEVFYAEYDNILLGTRSAGSTLLMSRQSGCKITDEVLKYAFAYYLRLSPSEVRDSLTHELLKKFKLTPLVKRIPCPEELDERVDVAYVAHHLYPETRDISAVDLVRKVYFEVVAGKRDKFPKMFFDSASGWERSRICFMAMIGEYKTFSDVGEMYAFFANEKEAKDLLCEYRLSAPLRDMYGSPIEYLHESLPKSLKNDYHYAMHTDPDFEREDYQEYWDALPPIGVPVPEEV
jgi:hypothetical protein